MFTLLFHQPFSFPEKIPVFCGHCGQYVSRLSTLSTKHRARQQKGKSKREMDSKPRALVD
jgi:hypothetical protein